MISTTDASARLEAKLRGQTTAQLLATCVEMDRNLAEHGRDHKDSIAWTLLSTHAADTITERHPEVDAQLDAWFADESADGLAFIQKRSYTELLLLACDQAGVA